MGTGTQSPAEEQVLKSIEHRRLKALVDGDLEVARQLHADDFQLINPFGGAVSKHEYLGMIESGDLKYLKWTPEDMAVRLYGDGAALRYRALIEVMFRGRGLPPRVHWHTDVYERRGGQWQVVLSQATEIHVEE